MNLTMNKTCVFNIKVTFFHWRRGVGREGRSEAGGRREEGGGRWGGGEEEDRGDWRREL